MREPGRQPAEACEFFFFRKLRRQPFSFIHGARQSVVTREKPAELAAMEADGGFRNGLKRTLRAAIEVEREYSDRLNHAEHAIVADGREHQGEKHIGENERRKYFGSFREERSNINDRI